MNQYEEIVRSTDNFIEFRTTLQEGCKTLLTLSYISKENTGVKEIGNKFTKEQILNLFGDCSNFFFFN